MTTTPNIPSLSSKVDPEIKKAFTALKSWFEMVGGVVSASDLTATGLFSRGANGSLTPNAPFLDTAIPPQITGFTVTGAFASIMLTWTDPRYRNLAYVEVWRAEVNSLGQAVRIGTTQSTMYADTPPQSSLSVTYYYWVRIVSGASVAGPYNSTSGTPGATANDPTYMLEVLSGQIRDGQLSRDLAAKIDVSETLAEIQANLDRMVGEAALGQVVASVEATKKTVAETNARTEAVAQEAFDRARAILDEADARGIAIAGEAAARSLLASRLVGTYEGTDLSEVTSGLIYQEKTTRSNETNALALQISLLFAGVEGGFDPYTTDYFDTDAAGWSGVNSVIAWNDGWIDQTSLSAAPAAMEKSGLSVMGSRYATVKFRIKRLEGTGWGIIVDFQTSGGWIAGKAATLQELLVGDTATITVDFSDTSPWTSSTITGIRVNTGETTADRFSFDWLSIGRQGPAVSVAAFQSEQQANADAHTAEATSRETLATKVVGTPDPSSLTIDTLSSGLLFDEKQSRTAADSAQVARLENLEATVNNASTGVAATSSALDAVKLTVNNSETGVSALGNRVQALESSVNDPDTGALALIAAEEKTRADQGEALTVEVESASSTFDLAGESLLAGIVAGETVRRASSAIILQERQTRADADSAEALARQTLAATVDANTAAIATEQIARSDADSAEAEARTALEVRVTTAEGGISENAAAILTEQSTRADADTAEAEARLALKAVVDANTAAIVAEQTARADADSAEATARTVLQTTVDEHTATIETQQQSIDGIEGEYTVKIDANGVVAGIGLINGPQGSEFGIRAGRFFIVDPAAPADQVLPFIVSGGKVYMDTALIANATIKSAMVESLAADKLTVPGTGTIWEAIINLGKITNAYIGDFIQSNNYAADSSGWKVDKTGFAEFQNIKARGDIEASSLGSHQAVGTANIVDAAVDTLQIKGQAVTVPVGASTATGTNMAPNTTTTVQTVVIESGNEPIMLIASCTFSGTRYNYPGGSSTKPVAVNIKRNGVSIYDTAYAALGFLWTTAVCDNSPPVGTVTYTITLTTSALENGETSFASANWHHSAMVALRLKR